MWPPKTILHPTDFSESSKEAFKLACGLAQLQHGKVVVLHALIPAVIAPAEIPLPPEIEWESKEEAKRLLNRIIPESADVTVEHQLVAGTAVDVILETVKKIRPDLIVMGTLGRSGLRRLMLGSVAENVIRRAGCPVLTARCNDKKEVIDVDKTVRSRAKPVTVP